MLQEDSEPEIVKGLSGDELDASNIISGGRTTRRGRPQFGGGGAQRYSKQAAVESDEDEW